MIINRELLNNTEKESNVDLTKCDLFEYTLEVASIMNNDISTFVEGFGLKDKGNRLPFLFRKILNAIFETLLNGIKKLFSKFLALLAQLASMGNSFEIELRSFKTKIKAFQGKVELDFPYYDYTNLEQIPEYYIYNSMVEMLEFYSYKYNEYMKRGVEAVNLVSGLVGEIDPVYEQNKFRNLLLGRKKDYSTNCSDFVRLCSEYFRHGDDAPRNNIVLDGKDIYHKYYEGYVNAKDEIKKINNEKAKVEKNIAVVKNKIKVDFFDLSKLDFFDNTAQASLNSSLSAIQRKLCTSVDLMCQDILIFYGQKLQAYKEFKDQSRKILVETIKACIVQGG